MKQQLRWAVMTLLCLSVVPLTQAQVVMRGGGESFPIILPGQFIMIGGDEPITVQTVRETSSQSSDFDLPALQEGDQILYINGTRVREWEALRDAYEDVEDDAEVKLGIRRGAETLIESFIKPSEETLAEAGIRMNRSVSFGGDAGGISISSDGTSGAAVAGNNTSFQMAGSPGSMRPWGGILLGEGDGQISVAFAATPFDGSDLKQGDVIKAINDTDVTTIDALVEAFDALDVGAEVRLTLEREGETASDTFKKPSADDMPQMQFRTQSGSN